LSGRDRTLALAPRAGERVVPGLRLLRAAERLVRAGRVARGAVRDGIRGSTCRAAERGRGSRGSSGLASTPAVAGPAGLRLLAAPRRDQPDVPGGRRRPAAV